LCAMVAEVIGGKGAASFPQGNLLVNTVKPEIIENPARTLELPRLVRSVSQMSAEGEPSRCVFSLNTKPEILDVLASFSIISALTV